MPTANFPDPFVLARRPHGGPLGWLAKTAPGTGSCLHPVNVATTLRAWALQQGHCITSSLATRTMNVCADSWALRLGTGICSASLACASLSVLHALASTL